MTLCWDYVSLNKSPPLLLEDELLLGSLLGAAYPLPRASSAWSKLVLNLHISPEPKTTSFNCSFPIGPQLCQRLGYNTPQPFPYLHYCL